MGNGNNNYQFDRKDTSKNDEYVCDKCKSQFESDYELKNHEIFSYISCPICDADEISSMRNHFFDQHSGLLEKDGFIKRKIINDIVNKFNAQLKVNENSIGIRTNSNCNITKNKEDKDLINTQQVTQKPKLNLNFADNEIKVKIVNCIFCSFANEDVRIVEEHINSEHLDLISPNNCVTYSCPICNCVYYDENEIESHVNVVHKDIISPQKDEELSKEYNVEQYLCPVCEVVVCDNTEKLDTHLRTHYEESAISPVSPIVSSDDFLAKEIQKEYKEALKQIEKRDFENLRAQYGMDNDGNFKEQSIANMEKAVREGKLSLNDFYEKQAELKVAESIGMDDGSSCIKDIMPYVLNQSKNSYNVENIYVCSGVDYYLSTYGDKGWGCGFRNLQMLLSSLMRSNVYYEKLQELWKITSSVEKNTKMTMPSISRLQLAIEWAWSQGFDPQGCEQLEGQLCNTRKWIGATEVTTLLSALRLRCELLDFHIVPDKKYHSNLSDWIINHFKKNKVQHPLYLQHQGHSRTVIGVEQLKNGNYTLLILDPGCNYNQMRVIKNNPRSDVPMGLIRKTSFNMKNVQYQVVSVIGVMQSEFEFQASKIIKSTKIC